MHTGDRVRHRVERAMLKLKPLVRLACQEKLVEEKSGELRIPFQLNSSNRKVLNEINGDFIIL